MFYKLKYDVTVYDVTTYDVPMAIMLPFTKYDLLSYNFANPPQKFFDCIHIVSSSLPPSFLSRRNRKDDNKKEYFDRWLAKLTSS
jgi:hypothetical protein